MAFYKVKGVAATTAYLSTETFSVKYSVIKRAFLGPTEHYKTLRFFFSLPIHLLPALTPKESGSREVPDEVLSYFPRSCSVVLTPVGKRNSGGERVINF